MIITRNKIFFVILFLGVIFNFLLVFDIHYYLKMAFFFTFFATIPGFLIMLIFKIRNVGFWKYVIYTICTSITFFLITILAIFCLNKFPMLNDKMLTLICNSSYFNIYNECNIEETEIPLPVDNIWIGKDDILYGYYNDKIVKSIDKGGTWNTVYEFTEGYSCRRIWIDSRGTIFAGREGIGKIYISRDNGNSWSISLEFVCQNQPLENGRKEGFGTLWNMDEDSQGNLYVGEYGGEWDVNCAYIHKSTDGGLTWSIAYDSLAYDWPGRHIHMVKVDKKNDYIYASQGDGYKRARLIRSTDYGVTWITLQSETTESWLDGIDAQYTTMLFFEDYRLFGTDSESPNKIIRTSDDVIFSPVFEFGGKKNEYVWSSSKNDNGIAFFGTVIQKAGNYAGLYETRDKGYSWCMVKDLGITTSGYQGVSSISNFSKEGYAFYHDSCNNKTYKFKNKPTKDRISLFRIKNRSLSLYKILVFFNITLLLFIFIAYKRNPDLEFKLRT